MAKTLKQTWDGMSNSEKASGIAGAASGALGLVSDAVTMAKDVDTTEADNAIEAVRSFHPNASNLDTLSNQLNTYKAAGTDWKGTDFEVSTGEELAALGKSAVSGAGAGAMFGPWGALIGAAAGLVSAGAGWAANAINSEKAAKDRNNQAMLANNIADARIESSKDTIMENEKDSFLGTLAAYGGPLFKHSGEFDNGLIFVDAGGTHQQNPMGGVLMGFDPQGIPNLVEEGEIIYNDYVFSNRLKPTKKMITDEGFSEKYKDWSFAKIVEDLQKESAERPNDIISKRGLDDMMNRMMTMQETVRQKKGLTGINKMMAYGGPTNKFQGDESNSKPTFWGKLLEGMQGIGYAAPMLSNAAKAIYNAAKPVDTSNLRAEEAYRQVPEMKLPRIGGKINYRPTDKSSVINPIYNQGLAGASTIQNFGNSGADIMNRTMLNNYNTQRVGADATIKTNAQDLLNRLQVGQFNVGIDQANLGATQAEQAANMSRYKDIAEGIVKDATGLEAFEQAKGQAIDKMSTAATQGIHDMLKEDKQLNWILNNPALAEAAATIYGKKKYGGMLTRRRK